MRDGVTMIDPASTYIDADVGPLGRGRLILGANVVLRGKTAIADNVRVDHRLR